MDTTTNLRIRTLRRRRRAQMRENLRRTIHTAIWLFATVALAAWMLSL